MALSKYNTVSFFPFLCTRAHTHILLGYLKLANMNYSGLGGEFETRNTFYVVNFPIEQKITQFKVTKVLSDTRRRVAEHTDYFSGYICRQGVLHC